jgi:predicted TIM-barrel enzyme
VSQGYESEPALEPTTVSRGRPDAARAVPAERIALVDLLDRVLAGGVVVAGEVTLSIADVDMVTVSLRALVTSVSALAGSGADAEGSAG